MADFDARILGHGELFARLPAGWRDLAFALQPIFGLTVPGNIAWSSAYLPGNAAIRALFGVIGDPALAGPCLAAVSILLLYGIARKLQPDDREFAAVAVLLLATSSQFLLTAMTPYSMTAHLALNLAWLFLALDDRPWSRAAALAVSFVACGLHQLVFHPIFAAPFLVLLWLDGKRGAAILYAVALGAFSLFWLAYWPIAIGTTLPDAVAAGHKDLGGGLFLARAAGALHDASQPTSLVFTIDNLLRLVSWQNPLAWVLFAAACRALPRQPRSARVLLYGILLMAIAVTLTMPFQGHGWGYRYLHGYLGSFALLGAYGWRALRSEYPHAQARLRFAAMASVPISLLILFPLRAYQANAFTAPYRNADAAIARIDADIVIVENGGKWYAQDLVRNDPYLRRRPIRLLAPAMNPAQEHRICHRYRVKVVSRFSPELAALRPFSSDGSISSSNEQLRMLRAAGCDITPSNERAGDGAVRAFSSAARAAAQG